MSALRRLRRHPALAAALKTQNELNGGTLGCKLPTPDSFPKNHVNSCWMVKEYLNRSLWSGSLYQQIPDRLNGQLTLPDITKYWAHDADPIEGNIGEKNKYIRCFNRAILQKLAEEPEKLIKQMAMELDPVCTKSANILNRKTNRNIILRNPQGKRFWRLPSAQQTSSGQQSLFQQIPTTGIADVLRMVDRDTGFIDCFCSCAGFPIQKPFP